MNASISPTEFSTRGFTSQRQIQIPVLNRGLTDPYAAPRTDAMAEPESAASWGQRAVRPDSLPVLRNDDGFWLLTWEGEESAVKCEPGAFYIAALLGKPASVPLSAFEVASASTGHCPCLDQPAALQPAAAEALALWLRRIAELERILDTTEHEPTKAEVTRELKAMYAWKPRQNASVLALSRAAELVHTAIFRFQQNLACATDLRAEPHRLLRRFAGHIRQFILVPSAACRPDFVYQPAN